MTKWSKALAVVAIGVFAGLLAPSTASAATHHHRAVVSAEASTNQPSAIPLTLGWGGE